MPIKSSPLALSYPKLLDPASLRLDPTAHPWEVWGVDATDGSGRRELLRRFSNEKLAVETARLLASRVANPDPLGGKIQPEYAVIAVVWKKFVTSRHVAIRRATEQMLQCQHQVAVEDPDWNDGPGID